jgi:hypothetical protein
MASASGPERLVITKAFILQSLAGGGVSVGGQIVSLLRLAKEPSHHADGWEETGRGATHAFFAGYLPSGIYFWHWLSRTSGHASTSRDGAYIHPPILLRAPNIRNAESRPGAEEIRHRCIALDAGTAALEEVKPWI